MYLVLELLAERCDHAKPHLAKKLEERVEGWVLSLVRNPEVLCEKVAAQAEAYRQRLRRSNHEIVRLRARLETIAKTRRGYLQQQAEGIIETMDELRTLLAPLDAERATVESEIEALGDQEDRFGELDMVPALVDEYLRDLAYLVNGSGIAPREYEIVPAERTPDNPLGAYTLTPGRVCTSTPEELAEKRLEARNVQSARFRDLTSPWIWL